MLFKPVAGSWSELFHCGTDDGIYRQCWQVELFFKWIKQNLKIKALLYG